MKTMRGGLLSAGVSFISAAVAYVVKIVLAWSLSPADFALFAMAAGVVAFASVFRDAGAGRILVQRSKRFDQLAPTVAWLSGMASLACGVLIAATSPLVAKAFARPELVPLLLLMAAQFPLSGLAPTSTARLTIDLRWGALGMTSLATLIASSLGSVAMAYNGFGVYSLVVPPLFAEGLRTGLLWTMGGVVRPRLDRAALRDVLSGSAYVLGSGLTLAARAQGDYLTLAVVERRAPQAVGTGNYYFAYTTAGAARGILTSFVSVLFPVLARMNDDRSRSHSAYCRALHSFAIVAMLIFALQASLSWPLFRLLLPGRWEGAATLFSILSAVHLLLLLNTVVAVRLQAEGRFRAQFFFDIMFAPFELAMFLVGALVAGPTGLATAAVLSAFVGFTTFHAFAFRRLGITWSESIGPLWKPLVALVPLALLALLLHRGWPADVRHDLFTIGTLSIAGSISYVAILYALWRPAMDDMVSLVRRSL